MSSKSPVILGLKITSHDTGAALIAKGRVVAIAEERLNRVKHSANMFPSLAIDYCLSEFKVSASEVDLVVIDQTGLREETRMKENFYLKTGNRFAKSRVEVINHHDAHAAAAFFCSPFNEAAVLIVDGSGEKIHTHLGSVMTETETLYRGVGNSLVRISKTGHIRKRLLFPYTTGIGKLYTLVSEGYLNFGHYNEGKMMGLAPYGDNRVLEKFPANLWYKEVGDSVVCNTKIIFEGYDEWAANKKFGGALWQMASRYYEKLGLKLLNLATAGKKELFVPPEIFSEIKLDLPRRKREDKLPTPYYAAVAHAVQKVLEEVMVKWGLKIKAITGLKNLCVSGGVGLNIDANKRFLDDVGFEGIFIQPAASDTGVALGCALWGAHQILGLPRFWQMKSASLGRQYSPMEIEGALKEKASQINFKKTSNICADTAKLISAGKITAWFQGGSEYGPRALGNRSILGDARDPEMTNRINEKVKHREPWRPFAASVLAEKQREWFELDHESPFMLLAAPVVKDKRQKVPSIVHVDGTCRIQSVSAESNRLYHDLLAAFNELTGVPMVLNTSFNDAGEPIVETPEDALRCFLNTEMDALVIGDYIVTKK